MALATIGTAVFRIVVSSDSMKNATATSHGSTRRVAGESPGGDFRDDFVVSVANFLQLLRRMPLSIGQLDG
jgi:hypothetical protein